MREEEIWNTFESLIVDSSLKSPVYERTKVRYRLSQLFVLMGWRDRVFAGFARDAKCLKLNMESVNNKFDRTILAMKPMWQKDDRVYDTVVKLCMEMGRTPPAK